MRENERFRGTPSRAGKRFADVNGLQVHYRAAGSGTPVLVLLHGSFLSMRSWRLVFDRLAEPFTVIALDRPAFGSTGRPLPLSGQVNVYSPEGQADLVAGLLEKLGHRQAVLVGNSTGGTIALLAALRHPEKVTGLVLADPMVYSGYATSEFPAWLYPVFRAVAPLGGLFATLMIRMVFSRLHRTFWHDRSMPENELLGQYRDDMMQGKWGRAFWELLLSSHNLDLEKKLHDIAVPVLVMTGDHDRMVKPDETIRLSCELPRAVLKVIPACGHLPQEEKPELFMAAVCDFLAQQF
ncbi:MAG: alpha/beta hydrolase [Chlorobi bacterium]|nr:alpha/beta hydrolase [Chlorobiota bacterium]